MTLKYFSLDSSRHERYVDVEFYQMNLSSVVDNARNSDPNLFIQDGVFLPSWSKFAAYPVKAKGFFSNMLQAIFVGKGGDDSLNVDYQTGRTASEGIKVAMMFLPGSTTNKNLLEIKPMAEQALPGFRVVVVSGAANITNATAEQRVKEEIERAQKLNQHVLILSAGMAQRSFSIPEITELYLAYDTGDNGATIQKISRTLTTDKPGKIGRVVSLSFDPNRDDKFDTLILETAQNYKKNRGIVDLKQALRDVLKTVDLFRCQEDGAIKIEIDTYLEEALSRNSIDRVIGKVADLNKLSPEQIHAIATGNADVFRAEKQEVTERGKTKNKTVKRSGYKSSISSFDKNIARAREVITTISQNIDIICFYANGNIDESFEVIDNEGLEIQQEVSDEFGVDYDLIKQLFKNGIINRDLVELKFV